MNLLTKIKDWLKKPVALPKIPFQSRSKKIPKDWYGNARLIAALRKCEKENINQVEFNARIMEAIRVDRLCKKWESQKTRFDYLGLIIEGKIAIGS